MKSTGVERHQLKLRMSTGRRVDGGIVFIDPEGERGSPRLLLPAMGSPRARQRDASHPTPRPTPSSRLLKANVPVKVVSERLGHSSSAFTMTVCQHVCRMQADAAAAFGDVVFGDAQCQARE